MKTVDQESGEFGRPLVSAVALVALLAVFFATAPVAAKTKLELASTLHANGAVATLRWSPDGKLLASGSSRSIQLWTGAGKPVRELTEHGSVVYGLAWSPDGNRMASAACDRRDGTGMHCVVGGVRVWNTKDWSVAQKLPLGDGHAHHHAPSPSKVPRNRADAIDPHSEPGAEVRAAAWSHDGKQLAIGTANGSVKIWNTGSWEAVHDARRHGFIVTALDWNDSGQLASVSLDDRIQIWDTAANEVTHTLTHHTLDLYAVGWHPQKSLLASAGADRVLVVWDKITKDIVKKLDGFDGSVRSLAWSPDGRHIAVGSYSIQRRAGEIRIYETRTWKRIAQASAHENLVRALAWRPDGKLLASGGDDRSIKLWAFKR